MLCEPLIGTVNSRVMDLPEQTWLFLCKIDDQSGINSYYAERKVVRSHRFIWVPLLLCLCSYVGCVLSFVFCCIFVFALRCPDLLQILASPL